MSSDYFNIEIYEVELDNGRVTRVRDELSLTNAVVELSRLQQAAREANRNVSYQVVREGEILLTRGV